MRYPIPARLAHRPVQGGLVVPYVSVVSQGRPVLGAIHTRKLVECLINRLCQVCGEPLGRPIVILAPDTTLAEHYSSEPPLHPECARYSMLACPHLAGRMEELRPHSRVEGRPCEDPECGCAGWVSTHPIRERVMPGAWFQVWVHGYVVAVNDQGVPHGVMWGMQLKVRPVRRQG